MALWLRSGQALSKRRSGLRLRRKARRELRRRPGKHFVNVWLGFMNKTPRGKLSGEALSYTFGLEALGAQRC